MKSFLMIAQMLMIALATLVTTPQAHAAHQRSYYDYDTEPVYRCGRELDDAMKFTGLYSPWTTFNVFFYPSKTKPNTFLVRAGTIDPNTDGNLRETARYTMERSENYPAVMFNGSDAKFVIELGYTAFSNPIPGVSRVTMVGGIDRGVGYFADHPELKFLCDQVRSNLYSY